MKNKYVNFLETCTVHSATFIIQTNNFVHLLIWIINYNVNLFSGRPSRLPRERALTSQKTWNSTFRMMKFT